MMHSSPTIVSVALSIMLACALRSTQAQQVSTETPGPGATCAQYLDAYRKGDVKLWLAWGDTRWNSLDATEVARGKPRAGVWLGNTPGAAEGLAQLCLAGISSGHTMMTFNDAVTMEYETVYARTTRQRADVWDKDAFAPSNQVIAKDGRWFVRKDGGDEGRPECRLDGSRDGLLLMALREDQSRIVLVAVTSHAWTNFASTHPVTAVISAGEVSVTAVKPIGRPAAIGEVHGSNASEAARNFVSAGKSVRIDFDDGGPSIQINMASAQRLLPAFARCIASLDRPS